jgi:uncharacterized membrane protein
MPPEERELLNKNIALAEENNSMLRSIKRSMLWGRVMSVIYWILIIGISVGAFYFLQPYIDQVVKTYGSFSNLIKNLGK